MAEQARSIVAFVHEIEKGLVINHPTHRSYELLPGYLRVYLGTGPDRLHEMDVALKTAEVEATTLPGKPHCISVKPETPKVWENDYLFHTVEDDQMRAD